MADNERRLRLIATVDEQAARSGQRSVAQLRQDFERLTAAERDQQAAAVRQAATLGDVRTSTQRLIAAVRERVRTMREELALTREQADALADVEQAQRRANDAFKQADDYNSNVRRRAGVLGDVDTAAQTLGMGLRSAGLEGPGAAVSGTGDVFAVLEALPQLGAAVKGLPASIEATVAGLIGVEASFGAIAAVALPLAAATAGVVIAWNRLQKTLEEGRNRLEAAIDAQRTYYELIETGTSDEIASRRDALAAQQRYNELIIQNLQQQRDAYANLDNGASALEAGIAIRELDKQIETLQQDSGAAQLEIDAYNRALNASEVAARDAAAAQAEAADGFVAMVQQLADERQQALDLGATGTQEQLDARRAAIERENQIIEEQIAQLQPFASTNADVADEIQRLVTRQQALKRETELLSSVTEPLIRQREKEANAVEAQTALNDRRQAILDARQEFDEALVALDESTAEKRAQILDQTETRIGDINDKLADQARSLAQDLLRADEKAGRQTADQIYDVERDLRKKEEELRSESLKSIEDLYEKHERDVARIQTSAQADINDAILNRDAQAQGRAERQRDQQLKDAQDQLDESVEQEQDALDERLQAARDAADERIRDLQESQRRERRERLIAARQRLDDQRRAADAEIRQARAAQTQQLRDLDMQYRRQRQLIQQRSAEQLQQIDSTYRQALGLQDKRQEQSIKAYDRYWREVLSIQGAAIKSISGTKSGGLKSYQSGGYVTDTGAIMAHGSPSRPELVLSPDNTAALQRELGRGFSQADLVRAVRGGGMTVAAQFGDVLLQGGSYRSMMDSLLRDVERNFRPLLLKTLQEELT